ncbi:MAG: alginate O-acetyltransferase, partial [Pseudomonas sp. BICA1-14]
MSWLAIPDYSTWLTGARLAVDRVCKETAGQVNHRLKRVKSTAVSDDFFVPELCQPDALLGLVLLAELLVFVLVLA